MVFKPTVAALPCLSPAPAPLRNRQAAELLALLELLELPDEPADFDEPDEESDEPEPLDDEPESEEPEDELSPFDEFDLSSDLLPEPLDEELRLSLR